MPDARPGNTERDHGDELTPRTARPNFDLMTEHVIRSAKPGDGEGLAGVWIDLCDYYAEIDPEIFQVPQNNGLVESFEKDLAKPLPDGAISLVAEVDGRIVGWIYAQVLAPTEDAQWQLLRELGKPRLVIEALGVERSFQRRGIGTKLVQAVEEWAVKQGAELLNVDTYVNSPVSVPFYEDGLGYKRRSVRFWKKLP
jgi:GNAT superfamily N-acetyltransferase